MAGVQSLKDEFLTCSICTDIYTDPCTLSCGHSFCRKCLTKYIFTRPDDVQAEKIPCAYCLQATKVPEPTKPVGEWARQIRPSLILQGLMDKLQSGHKQVEGQDICFLCEEVGEITPASSWCSDCEVTLCSRCTKMHLKAPSSKGHEVFDLSEGVKVKKKRKVKCTEHGEQINFLCKDCHKMACQKCCVLNHRTCEHVVTSEAMIQEIKTTLKKKRLALQEKIKDGKDKTKQDLSKERIILATKKHRSDIRSKIEHAIWLLKKEEEKLLNDLDDASNKQIVQYDAYLKSSQATTQMYQQHCEFIDQALQSESEMDMYDMYQICLSEMGESTNTATGTDTKNPPLVDEVTVTFNTEPLKSAITEMAKVKVSSLTCTIARVEKSEPSPLPTPVLHDTIHITHGEDVKSPGPTDATAMTVSGVQTVVVADCNNKCLKAVFIKNETRDIRKLNLTANPLRLVKMEGNRVVATAENSHIIVAEVRPLLLVLISDLRTRKEYHSVTALSGSRIAVGSFTPPIIDILNLKGNVLLSFTPVNTGLDILQNPHYLSTTLEGNILISDCYSKSVYCLTTEGKSVFTFKPAGEKALEYPRGLTVTDKGDVLLADWGSKKIIQLTSDGTYVRDILTSADGIDVPWGLCVNETNKLLYVCQRAVEEKCIKVFKFT